ncbi:hypothetical protein EBZ70_10195 [bacterium]|nr:hypothetical protein [bacterium]
MPNAAQTAAPQILLCLKWGKRYGSDYVNRTYAMAMRNTSRPLRVVCFTDDPAGIRPEVDVKPMPPASSFSKRAASSPTAPTTPFTPATRSTANSTTARR